MTKKVGTKKKQRTANEVPYEPIKVGLAVAAAASACLVLFAVIAIYNS